MCIPESSDLLPGSTHSDVRESYREDFFFGAAFFARVVAFFAGFFLAILGMRSPPLKKCVSNSIHVYRQAYKNHEYFSEFFAEWLKATQQQCPSAAKVSRLVRAESG